MYTNIQNYMYQKHKCKGVIHLPPRLFSVYTGYSWYNLNPRAQQFGMDIHNIYNKHTTEVTKKTNMFTKVTEKVN